MATGNPPPVRSPHGGGESSSTLKWTSRYLWWLALFIGVGAYIAMTEVDRIIGRSTTTGDHATIRGVVGPSALANIDGWSAWRDGPEAISQIHGIVAALIVALAVCEFVFVVCITYLLARIIVTATSSPDQAGYSRIAAGSVGVFAAAALLEILLLVIASRFVAHDDTAHGLHVAIAVVATCKWLAVVAVILAVARNDFFRRVVVRSVKKQAECVWIQRLSVVVVVLLAVMSLLPASGALDQIPDAQRRWLGTDFRWSSALVILVAYGVIAAGLFFIGSWRANLVGIRVKDHGIRNRSPAMLWLWLIAPTGVLVAAIALRWRHGDLVDANVVAFFVLFFATIAVTSALIRLVELTGQEGAGHHGVIAAVISVPIRLVELSLDGDVPRRRVISAIGVAVWGVALSVTAIVVAWSGAEPRWRVLVMVIPTVIVIAGPVYTFFAMRHEVRVQARARATTITGSDVQIVGNICVILFLGFGALGLIRAFAGPIALDAAVGGEAVAPQRAQVAFGVAVVFLMGVSALAAIALRLDPFAAGSDREPSHAMIRLARRLQRALADDGARRKLLVVLGVLVVIPLAAYAIAPSGTASAFGIMGTVTFVIGVWPLLLGVIIVGIQYRRPPEIFAVLSMEAAPILSLALVLMVVVTLTGGDPDLHRIHARDYQAMAAGDTRADLDAAFTAWVNTNTDCAYQIGADGQSVSARPLVLVAASGGGIRAAVWTANSMATMMRSADGPAGNGICGSAANFLSSGVSGGSVGLALARAETADSGDPSDPSGVAKAADEIRSAATTLTDPQALAAGLSSTVVGDTVASATGLRAQRHDGALTWNDRAALIEDGWEHQIPALREDYQWSRTGAPTGALVFNSTSTGVHCRMLISQLRLGVTAPQTLGEDTDISDCVTATGQPAISVDFADVFHGCVPTMSWATAAMLSARFPYVTPSGRIFAPATQHTANPECHDNSWQLIDGGYADSTGLGTVADIAPELAQIIARHNASAGGDVPYVIPYVVYLDDEPQVARPVGAPGATPEALVPVVGRAAQKALAGKESWVQRITNAFDEVCVNAVAGSCEATRAALRSRMDRTDGETTYDGSVITVAPRLVPSVEVPLGWTLSRRTVEALRRAAGTDLCTTGDPDRSLGFDTLAALVCHR
ncbi:hypothetical protein [Gordonia rhizosphera]|uniref:PNPLA domain-containing protein n=1 Tax=Gordonia rhizosphera NBRC 16068 TaxID=1108045 RepID=K6WCN2_9ACTN|nr:hypothetical protein [Gordonia rhizosphera]GAB91491.1 hypothetical protein GORHZ_135_00390 [Gordonia rhizosphera NBRC 16068]